MRIRQLQQTSPPTGTAAVAEHRGPGGSGLSFQRQMSELNQAAYEEHIRQLARRITDQGRVVARSANLAELQKYRALIAELLQEAASNAFLFSRRDRLDGRGRYKMLAVIKRINQRLDDLTAEVLREQADNLRILSLVDEVRGLLVDLLL